MPTLRYNGLEFRADTAESVLDCLLRHGQDVPSACRVGACQTCLMRAVEGTPSTASQNGLRETQRRQGYFLACQCVPTDGLSLIPAATDFENRAQAEIIQKTWVSNSILRLRLELRSPLEYYAGQFLRLRFPDGLQRSYSIASLPGEPLELHIRVHPKGEMGQRLSKQVRPGDVVELVGPYGSCYYTPNDLDQPILMVASGSGLAPIWGIVRDALAQGHRGPIRIYHGSVTSQGLYYFPELARLSERNLNLSYVPCAETVEPSELHVRPGTAMAIAMEDHKILTGWRVYTCGHPALVKAMKRAAYLAGADLNQIFSDSFADQGSVRTA
jgi:CDP-4-dehydro-6-deoxyglucose reductase, E3